MSGLPDRSPRHLRVASYNIRKCIGLDRRRDPRRIAGILRGLDADIVALQEADKRLGSRPAALPPNLIQSETDLNPVRVSQTQVSLGFHGNAILLARAWGVDEIHRLFLPGLEPRGAVILDVSGPHTPLRVIATHLGLRRRDRQRQMGLIMAETMRMPHRPTVLLGDFNEWSANQGFGPLDPYFTLHNPGRSFPAWGPIAALDRVATGPGLRLVRGGVMRAGPAGRASDHLPIWADLAPDG